MHLRVPITPDALNAITQCAEKQITAVAVTDIDTARFHEGFDGYLVSKLHLTMSDTSTLTIWAETRQFPVEGVSYGFETFVLEAELSSPHGASAGASALDNISEFTPLANAIVGTTIRSFELMVHRDGYQPDVNPAFLVDIGVRINTDAAVVECFTEGVLPTWLGVRALTVVRADAM